MARKQLLVDLDEIITEKNVKLIPENIKKNVTILGVKGSLEADYTQTEDYQECLSIANDILS